MVGVGCLMFVCLGLFQVLSFHKNLSVSPLCLKSRKTLGGGVGVVSEVGRKKGEIFIYLSGFVLGLQAEMIAI